MDTAGRGWGGRLVELDDQECWALLAGRAVGRVAWDDGSGPVVVPVNHVVHEGAVRFRTSPYSTLGTGLVGRRVAFEVDDVEELHSAGWSVLVRGRARAVDLDAHEEGPTPWPEGMRAMVIEVEADEITGRRLLGS